MKKSIKFIIISLFLGFILFGVTSDNAELRNGTHKNASAEIISSKLRLYSDVDSATVNTRISPILTTVKSVNAFPQEQKNNFEEYVFATLPDSKIIYSFSYNAELRNNAFKNTLSEIVSSTLRFYPNVTNATVNAQSSPILTTVESVNDLSQEQKNSIEKYVFAAFPDSKIIYLHSCSIVKGK